jgi:hypothetical protein
MQRNRLSASPGAPFYAAATLIPVAVFLWFFHWQILVPTNVSWLLAGDWGASVIGWSGLRHDDWRWPLGLTKLLAWPSGVPVTYTDSNPLICLLLKPFAGVLPEPFQFTGPWLFGCIVLQFWAAWALLRGAAETRGLRLLGATLLTVVPTLINRMGHANLCAHWTILVALYAFLHVEREGRKDLIYGAVLTLSALVHPYLLLINAAIWASDVLRRSWRALRAGALAAFGALAVRSAAVALVPMAALWAVGGLGGFEGAGGGFGYYSMALDALINPGTAGYSRIFPARPQGEGQVFEGFQYLGAGLIALVLVGLAALGTRAGRERLCRMGWLAWLGPALFVLFALALSDHIRLHDRVVGRLSYDWIPFHLTSTFRSSGRLFWPCAYVLILVSLTLALSLPRRWAWTVSLAALALQLFDLTGFTAAARGMTAEAAAPNGYIRTPSSKWETLIASATVVEFQPPDPHLEQKAFYEIAWRATALRRPVNVMYTARVDPRQKGFEAAGRKRFLQGQLDPRHLYVVTDGCIPAGVDPSRLKLVNRIMVIPPARASYPFALRPAPPPEPFPLGRTVTVSPETPQLACTLAYDFSPVEDWGAWSNGDNPELIFRLAARPQHDLLLTLVAQPFPTDGQGATVMLGGRAVGRIAMPKGGVATYSVRLPAALISGPTFDVVLHVDHPQQPSVISHSPDVRRLGIGIRSLRLDPAP